MYAEEAKRMHENPLSPAAITHQRFQEKYYLAAAFNTNSGP